MELCQWPIEESANSRLVCNRDPQEDTVVVDDQYLQVTTVHGRDFQTYSVENSVYLVPVDEVGKYDRLYGLLRQRRLKYRQDEIDLLTAQHRLLDIVFDGRLIFPPITNVSNVLDCGYGAASWAIEVADSYPQSRVCHHISS